MQSHTSIQQFLWLVINIINEMQDVNYEETCTLPSINKLNHGTSLVSRDVTYFNTMSICFVPHEYGVELEESMASRDGLRHR
jgi:hypothetical protein